MKADQHPLYLPKLPECASPKKDSLGTSQLLSCQPRVTVTSCLVYKVTRDIESIDHLCIMRVSSSEVYTLVFYLAIVIKVLRHCHSRLARQ